MTNSFLANILFAFGVVDAVNISENPLLVIGVTAALTLLCVLLYLVICRVTAIRIHPGTFYVAALERYGMSWEVERCNSFSVSSCPVLSVTPR